jgi:hypothetical protein
MPYVSISSHNKLAKLRKDTVTIELAAIRNGGKTGSNHTTHDLSLSP